MSGHVYLIGFMGAGKSSVGRLVADRLGRPFMDLDAEVELSSGQRIAEIFADRGEAAFRDLESATLATVAELDPRVVACGGGVVLSESNRTLLAETGTVVYLSADPVDLLERTAAHGSRPLRDDDSETFLALLESRRPLYEAVAEITVETSGSDPADVASQVAEAVEES